MTQLKHPGAGLLALLTSLALQGGAAAATDAAAAFRILSEQEIAAHTAVMNSLQGTARDEYRNAQYEHLRTRALENGFRLPPSPPWVAQAGAADTAQGVTVEASPPSDEDVAAEAAARHAAMRERLEAQRGAAQAPGGDAAPAAAPEEPRFAPVEEIAAAQAVTAPQAAPAPPAAPPVPEVQAASPPPGPYPLGPATPVAESAPPAEPPAGTVAETAEPMDAPEQAATETASPAQAGPDTMNAYRESMRARFDAYMQERQAQHEEALRRQREQREAQMAQMAQERAQANRNRPQPPYPYPAMPAYGPRYPAAFPGYRTPYWQQPQQ